MPVPLQRNMPNRRNEYVNMPVNNHPMPQTNDQNSISSASPDLSHHNHAPPLPPHNYANMPINKNPLPPPRTEEQQPRRTYNFNRQSRYQNIESDQEPLSYNDTQTLRADQKLEYPPPPKEDLKSNGFSDSTDSSAKPQFRQLHLDYGGGNNGRSESRATAAEPQQATRIPTGHARRENRASLRAKHRRDMEQAQAQAQAQAQHHAQYLNFSNQVAALSSQIEAANYINNTAANLVRAAAAAQITQSPMTTLAFTKPISSSDDNNRFGLKIPQPNVSRQSSPSVSSFGTSRLQVKVNSDKPAVAADKALPTTKSESGSPSVTKSPTTTSSNNTSNKIASGIHSMPAMIPFHDMKKVHAIPKTVSNSNRSLPISSLMNKSLTNSPTKSVSPVTSSAPVKSSDAGSGKLSPSNHFKPVTQVNSLKKLVADLNSVKQKKAENLLNTLKKNSENQMLSESKKAFLGLDQNKINEKPKEVTSS